MPADWRKRSEILGQSPAELLAQRRRIFTISNGISLLRVVALPFALHSLTLPADEGLVPTVGLLAFMALSDLLDGFVARRLHQVSDAGRVIDPLADKLCIGMGTIWLTIYRDLPFWIPALVITRDILIIAGAILLVRRTDLVLPSNLLGRLTTVTLALTFFSYVIGWRWSQRALVYTSGALVVASFLVYLRIGWHILRRLEPH